MFKDQKSTLTTVHICSKHQLCQSLMSTGCFLVPGWTDRFMLLWHNVCCRTYQPLALTKEKPQASTYDLHWHIISLIIICQSTFRAICLTELSILSLRVASHRRCEIFLAEFPFQVKFLRQTAKLPGNCCKWKALASMLLIGAFASQIDMPLHCGIIFVVLSQLSPMWYPLSFEVNVDSGCKLTTRQRDSCLQVSALGFVPPGYMNFPMCSVDSS